MSKLQVGVGERLVQCKRTAVGLLSGIQLPLFFQCVTILDPDVL